MVTSGIDMRTAIIILCKYRMRAVLVFFGFLMISVAICALMRTQYAGTASLLVKIGRELIYRPDVGDVQAALPTIDKDENIASAIEIMQSDSIIERVIGTIGLSRMYPEVSNPPQPVTLLQRAVVGLIETVDNALGMRPEAPMTTATRLFKRKLKISVVKKTDIVQVTFLHPEPAIAARAANLVVDYFQKQSGEIYSDPNLAFQQQHVDEQRLGLEQAQVRLTTFRQQYRVYDLNAQVGALLQQKMTIDTALKVDEAHLVELQSVVATLEAQRAATPPRLTLFSDTERNRAVDDAEAQLLSLRLQEKQMASHFRDDYGPLITLREQIAMAHSAVNSGRLGSAPQVRTGINDTYQLLDQQTMQRETELKAMFGRQDAMRAQIATIDASIKDLSSREDMLQNLQRDVDLRTESLKTTYDKLVEARAVEGLNHAKPASFSLYQPAVPADPANPARPLPLLYTLVAGLVGSVGAVTAVFLSYKMSRGFLTPELARRRLQLPVLAVVDYQRKLARGRSVRHHNVSEVILHGSSQGIPVATR